MLSVLMEIDNIDYARTAEHVMPRLLGRVQSRAQPRSYEKMLLYLDTDAVAVTQKLLQHIDEKTRSELVAWLVCRESDSLCRHCNAYLDKCLGEGTVHLGSIQAGVREDGILSVLASDVEIDYAALVDSPLVSDKLHSVEGISGGLLRGAAKLASKLPAESLEKRGLALLESESNKAKVLSLVSDALAHMGLVMHVRDLIIEKREVIHLPGQIGQGADLWIPEALEEPLLKALAACLRESVH